MSANFTKITINLYNTVITLEPEKCYYISNNPRNVIMYRLTFQDNNPTAASPGVGLGFSHPVSNIQTCSIPYYQSDGHTNRLRANMLYPFMCFKLAGCASSPQGCTDEVLGNGGLMKYNIGTNINTMRIKEYVDGATLHKMRNTDPEGVRKLHVDSNGGRVGLPSVLPRLTNLLDYLIAITAQPILKFSEIKLECFRPIIDDKFNMEMCDTRPLGPENARYNTEDIYRSYILLSLNDQINMLMRYGFISLETVSLESTQVTMTQFNDEIGIATRFAENAENVKKYGMISNELHKNIKMYVGHLKGPHGFSLLRQHLIDSGKGDIGNNEKSKSTFAHFFNNLDKLLVHSNNRTPFEDLLKHSIMRWGCPDPSTVVAPVVAAAILEIDDDGDEMEIVDAMKGGSLNHKISMNFNNCNVV